MQLHTLVLVLLLLFVRYSSQEVIDVASPLPLATLFKLYTAAVDPRTQFALVPTNSTNAKRLFSSGNAVDLIITETALPAALHTVSKCNTAYDVFEIPITLDGLAIVYNIPGVDVNLTLSGDMLAAIYTGAVTSWDDPQFASQLPGVQLPSLPITPYYLAGSDLSSVFDIAMQTFANSWTRVNGNWASLTAVKAVNSEGSQGSEKMQAAVASGSSIGFLPYSHAKASGLKTAALRNVGGDVTISDTAFANAVADNAQSLRLNMQLVTGNPNGGYIPDMWDLGGLNRGSWPFTYFNLVTIRLHSVANLDKAQNITKFLSWILGSSAAKEQLASMDMMPLTSDVAPFAIATAGKMSVCQTVSGVNKTTLRGQGSDVAGATTTQLAQIFSTSPSYTKIISYSYGSPVTAAQQVISGALDFVITTTPLTDSSIHTFPFLGIAVALVVKLPGTMALNLVLSAADIRTIFTGGAVNPNSINSQHPNCTLSPIMQAHPDVAYIFSTAMKALGQTGSYTFASSNDDAVGNLLEAASCGIAIVSADYAFGLERPKRIVQFKTADQRVAAFDPETLALAAAQGTINTPSYKGYPFVGYLYISIQVNQASNCDSKVGLAQFINFVATDTAAATAARVGATLISPFSNEIGKQLGALQCNGVPLITPITQLAGGGSIFAHPMHAVWATAYPAREPLVKITYTQSSSAEGVDNLIANKVNFAASDSEPSSAQFSQGNDLGLYPVVAGAIVLAYRLDNVSDSGAPLRFTRDIIADIYLGKIRNWNDAKIQQLNPTFRLPAHQIDLMYDASEYGVSSVMVSALSSFSPSWTVKSSANITWPVSGSNVRGSIAMAAKITNTNYGLGYLGLAHAQRASLNFVQIQNKAGTWVTASPDTVKSAIADYAKAFDSQLRCSLVDGVGANSWPISTYTYTILHQTSMTDFDLAGKLINFTIWTVNGTDGLVEANGYAPLPQNLLDEKLVPQLKQIRVNGRYVLGAPPGTDPAEKEKKKDIALGVGLGIGLFVLLALILAFFAYRYRKSHKTFIDPRTILSEVWDDKGETQELLNGADTLATSPSLTSTPSSSGGLSRLLKGKNTTLEANTDIAIGSGKPVFHFGLQSGLRFPVDKEMTENIELTNNSNSSVSYQIYVPHSEYQFRLQITPGRGTIKKGETKTVQAKLTLLMTTNLTRKVKFEFTGQGQKTSSIVSFSLSGEVSTKLDPDDIEIHGKAIGKGAFGTVYKGEYRGSAVAIKVLRRQNDLRDDQLEEFLKEIELMGKLRSPYIVNLLGASYVPGKLCVLTEFMDKGSVSRVLKAGPIPNVIRMKIAVDCCKAMAFLHNNGVMHRDLKPANLLVVSLSKSAEISVKISDFGTSRSVLQIYKNERHTKGLGTPKYMAPELFTGSNYSGKVDVFAFSVLLLELFIQKDPYSSLQRAWDIPDFVAKGNRPEIPADVPQEVVPIIKACWAQNPEERPDFNRLIDMLEPLNISEARKAQAIKYGKAPGGAGRAELDYDDESNSNSNSKSGGTGKYEMSGGYSENSRTNNKNERGERITWGALQKQFEEGTDGGDITMTKM